MVPSYEPTTRTSSPLSDSSIGVPALRSLTESPIMQLILLVCLPPFMDLSRMQLLISRFQSLIEPSSWPVATRQELMRNVMQDTSAFTGASRMLMVSIFLEFHSLMVLSREAVRILGMSLMDSLVCSLILLGSSAWILITASV